MNQATAQPLTFEQAQALVHMDEELAAGLRRVENLNFTMLKTKLVRDQVMTTEQSARNVEIKPGSGQRVEYAIKLPGDGAEGEGGALWLPIDVKLPKEDYERLVDASERGDAIAV